MERVIFRNKLAIGDNLVFTTALREMHKQYPNKYQTGVLSYYPEVYENNPYVYQFDKEEAKSIIVIDVDYSHVFKNRGISGKHFADGYIHCLNKTFGTEVELTDCRPEIYLTEEEKAKALEIISNNDIPENFWLLAPAIKQDIPLKNYSAYNWQIFANCMHDMGVTLVQTGDKTAINPKIKNIKSLVGKLDLREYFAVAALSKGMIGHVSLQTHLAAALNKPCITVNGGRENINWYSYSNQQFVHTVGMLNCCLNSGCWLKTIQECHNFDMSAGIAKCMQLIELNHLIALVLKYDQKS